MLFLLHCLHCRLPFKEWGIFHTYHRLFFTTRSFGPGGNNADTAGAEEDDEYTSSSAKVKTPPPCHVGEKRGAASDNSDVEPGKKPCRETSCKRSSMSMLELYPSMQEKMTKTEDKREENIIQFERQLEEDRRQLEEKREQERREREENLEQRRIEREERIERQQQELEDKPVREQREYEKKKEKERGEAPAAVRQSEKEFSSQLLVHLFAVKKD